RRSTQCGLDGPTMASWALQAGHTDRSQAQALAEILALTVDQAHQVEVGREEAHVLTHNLENTYEELHLVYEISRHMGLPQSPAQAPRRVGWEVVEVRRAQSIGFGLAAIDGEETPAADTPATHGGGQIVLIGDGIEEPELHRLVKTLPIDSESASAREADW